MKTKIHIVLVIIIAAMLLLSGCSSLEMLSKWQDDDITIDGSKQDWGNNLEYLKDEKVAVGISNDEQNLYLCLVVQENNKIMSILRSGFTIWIDPQNSDAETFGIQYPIKKITKNPGDFRKKQTSSNRANRNHNLLNNLINDQDEFLILNEDKYPLSAYSINNNIGIEIKMGLEMNQLVYELKIPFANNDYNFATVDRKLNEEIKLGFISEVMKKPGRGNRQGGMSSGRGGRSGGGRSGGSGRSGGRAGDGMSGGGQRPQMDRMKVEPVNFWINTIISAH